MRLSDVSDVLVFRAVKNTGHCLEELQISGALLSSQLGRSFSMNYSEVTISNSIPRTGGYSTDFTAVTEPGVKL